MKMKAALFILPVSTQPRFSKRINEFISLGYNITVATFERDYFNLNSLPEGIEVISLGKIENGNYLKRIPSLLKSIFSIMKLSIGKNMIYIFSSDILLFTGFFLQKKKIVYEIGDIREYDNRNFLSYIYHTIYQYMLQRCLSITVTSIGFKNYIVKRYSLKSDKIKIIENKLQIGEFFNAEEKILFKKISDNFTLGIIGYLRYDNIIEFLKAYQNCNNNTFKIVIFGDGHLKTKILKFVDDDSIKYFGQFRYPNDIKNIYNKIDLSFSMYDSNDLNVKLALPNKLYESMYFKKPIIASSDTYLSELIKQYGIGFYWDQNDMQGLIKYLNSHKFIIDYNQLEKQFEYINTDIYLQ